MIETFITPSIRAEAGELHRRRLAAGHTMMPKIETTVAQLGLLEHYGKVLRLDDLNDWLRVAPLDDSGNEIRVVVSQRMTNRIYFSSLRPIIVFATVTPDHILWRGWVTQEEILEAPVQSFTNDDGEVDQFYELEDEALASMPENFDFSATCSHAAGIWDYLYDSWDCAGCGRKIPSAWDSDVARGVVQLVAAGSKEAQGPERARLVGGSGTESELREQDGSRRDRTLSEMLRSTSEGR